ncbi:DUF58 domain-containing protein [Treponema phagedenis]|nr:DUF58 domain-containing protein [Treponema phagedenis]
MLKKMGNVYTISGMNSDSIIEKAKKLQFSALYLAEGMRTGTFNSCFRGQGIEFDSVRKYQIGDDIRSIDRNLTARSGKTYVRLYKEERELQIFIIVDLSFSMESCFDCVSAKSKALEAAGLLSFAALHTATPFGGLIFDGKIGKYFEPRAGKNAVLCFLKECDVFANQPGSPGTALAEALQTSAKVLHTRSMVIVISDFKVEGFEREFIFLGKTHDLIAVRLISPSDKKIPEGGFIPFTDPETGIRLSLPTSSKQFMQERKRLYTEEIHRWKALCFRAGAAPLLFPIEQDSFKILYSFFSQRSKTHAQKKYTERYI